MKQPVGVDMSIPEGDAVRSESEEKASVADENAGVADENAGVADENVRVADEDVRKEGLDVDVPEEKVVPAEKEAEPQNEDNSQSSVVTPRWNKLLVGEETATATHTCEGDLHAVDDDGNACIPDLEYHLFRSVIYVADTPDVSYMACAIPKNGCTYHLAMINRVSGESNYESTGVVHDMERKNKYFKLSSKGTEKLSRMLVNSSIPKYAVVRNPLQRTMSAYLNKVESFLPQEQRTVENFHEWLYKEFPKNMALDRSFLGMNPHWIPQSEFCGFNLRDVHSYFKIFRVEEPAQYVDFMYKIIPEQFLKDGWAGEANLSFRDHVLGPRIRTEGTSEKFLKYFNNLEVFDHLARVLSRDIETLGYQEDVRRLRESVKERMLQLSKDEDDDLD